MASAQTRFCSNEQHAEKDASTVECYFHVDLVLLILLVFRSWRAYKIIQRIPADQRAIFELKLLAGDYLQQRPSFLETSIRQEWKGDYLLLVSINRMNRIKIDLLILAGRKCSYTRISKINK